MKYILSCITLASCAILLSGCGNSTAENPSNTNQQSVISNTNTNKQMSVTNTDSTATNTNTDSEQSINTNTNSSFNTNSDTATDTTGSNENNDFTLAEVAKHATKADCWLVIEGGVYDVTDFIPKHPGRDRILEGCGKDATDLFTGKSMLGRIHSSIARAQLKKYRIADLDQ